MHIFEYSGITENIPTDIAETIAKIESGELKEETKLADKYLDEQVEAKRNAMLVKRKNW